MTSTVFAPSLFPSWEHYELFSVHENICGKPSRGYKAPVPKVDGRLVRSLLAWEPANRIQQGGREAGRAPRDGRGSAEHKESTAQRAYIPNNSCGKKPASKALAAVC